MKTKIILNKRKNRELIRLIDFYLSSYFQSSIFSKFFELIKSLSLNKQSLNSPLLQKEDPKTV